MKPFLCFITILQNYLKIRHSNGISDSHKFIFVHVRKAAGSSIRDTLEPLSIKPAKKLASKVKSRLLKTEVVYQKFAYRQHSDILKVKKIMPKAIFDAYFKFAFIRNPWKRLVSEIEFIKRTPDHGRFKKVNKISFDEYIVYQSKRGDAHMVNMLCDKNGILQMDFIGRFENLQEDWNYVCSKLNIENKQLTHRKRGDKIDYSQYYNQKNKDLVSKLWSKDIETFNYSYED